MSKNSNGYRAGLRALTDFSNLPGFQSDEYPEELTIEQLRPLQPVDRPMRKDWSNTRFFVTVWLGYLALMILVIWSVDQAALR